MAGNYTNRSQGQVGAKMFSGGYIRPVIAAAANFTLKASESGSIIRVGAANLVITLPPTQAGLEYTFVLEAAGLSTTVNGLQISPDAADAINGNGLTSVDNKDLFLAQASDREGDAVTLVGDGVDGWYITSVVGTWTKEP